MRIRGRTAPADRRLRMTLRTTVAIERRSQAGSGFSRYASTDRIYFHEGPNRLVEEGLFVGTQSGKQSPRSRGTTTWPRIVLSLKASCVHDYRQRETHNR